MPHLGLFYCTGRMGGLQNRLTTPKGWLCQHFPLKYFTMYLNPDPFEDKFSKLKFKFSNV